MFKKIRLWVLGGFPYFKYFASGGWGLRKWKGRATLSGTWMFLTLSNKNPNDKMTTDQSLLRNFPSSISRRTSASSRFRYFLQPSRIQNTSSTDVDEDRIRMTMRMTMMMRMMKTMRMVR